MDKLLNFAKGRKTYITALMGILIAFVGYALGPIDVGNVSVPAINFNDFVTIAWEALLVIFLRKGVSKK